MVELNAPGLRSMYLAYAVDADGQKLDGANSTLETAICKLHISM